ncbi:MAG: hypothetical protein R3B13_09590 [Polyangiaceae bacterium]
MSVTLVDATVAVVVTVVAYLGLDRTGQDVGKRLRQLYLVAGDQGRGRTARGSNRVGVRLVGAGEADDVRLDLVVLAAEGDAGVEHRGGRVDGGRLAVAAAAVGVAVRHQQHVEIATRGIRGRHGGGVGSGKP